MKAPVTTTDTPAADAVIETSPEPTTGSGPDYSSPSAIQAQNVTFADFGVRPEIVEALKDAGITHPFPIQAMTLPVAMSGHDIIGQAKTGTGKTLGFGVPLLHRVVAPGEPGYDQLVAPGKPQAVVVVPTRELAVQVANDLAAASSRRNVRIVQVYGGRAYEPQIEAMKTGVDVVVGTPGRMIDLLNQGHLTLLRAATVVLDEADEMLDLGFLPDVEKILARTPAQRHTMLFSATMPGAVVSMARRYMKQPTHIRAAEPDDQGATVKNIKQVVYRAHALDKIEVLARLLQAEGRGRTIVFARTKRTAAKVADELQTRGFAAGAIHGDLGQGAREQALRAFRNSKIDVLVATDVAARGIDVDDVTHVVNYQCPEDERIYLHRVGRTGRAGNTGTAVTFVDWDDVPRWSLIDKALEVGFPEPVETYSTSPHLFADLNIPEGTKGRLPRSAQHLAGLDAEDVEDLGETGKRNSGSRSSAGGRSGAPRSGAPRSGGRQGGSQGAPRSAPRADGGTAAPAAADAVPSDDRPASGGEDEGGQRRRRNRSRRRTRGGQPESGQPES
jgi:superfamily II DNA/RNA helicase